MTFETTTAAEWLALADRELAGALAAWRTGNAGKGRVGSRRAAGMALNAWLLGTPREGYGRSFMHHLNALADDPTIAAAVREAAWRLSARPLPTSGWEVPPPAALTPMDDARAIMDWVRPAIAD